MPARFATDDWLSAKQFVSQEAIDDTIYRLLPKDAIPAIHGPEFEAVEAANRVMRRNEAFWFGWNYVPRSEVG